MFSLIGITSISNILNRYFVIIFGLIDNIKLKGLNLGPNNGCGKSNWSNSCDNNFFYSIQNCKIEDQTFNFNVSQLG